MADTYKAVYNTNSCVEKGAKKQIGREREK